MALDFVSTQNGILSANTDAYGRIKELSAYILNPARQPICRINGITQFDITPKFNDISQIIFEVQKYITDRSTLEQIENPAYKYLHSFCEIYVPELGKKAFYIINVEPTITASSTVNESKTFTADSYESVLQYENLVLFDINQGTETSLEYYEDVPSGASSNNVRLYWPSNPNLSLLNLVLTDDYYGWQIGHVDSSIANLERSFSVDNQNVYAFLHTDVSTAFRCIFDFDTASKLINVYDIETVGDDTNIYMSFDHFVKQINVSPSTENMYTVFNVAGADSLGIVNVNFGSNKVIDITWPMSMLDTDLQSRYYRYLEYRESLRQSYIDCSFQYAELLIQMNAIMDRQPDDLLQNNWSSPLYTLDQLKVYLSNCETIVSEIESIYTLADGSIDVSSLDKSPDAQQYYSFTLVAIPDLKTEIARREAGNVKDVEQVDQTYLFQLYGLTALLEKRQEIQNNIDALTEAGYDSDKWNQNDNFYRLTYQDQHDRYVEYTSYLAEVDRLIKEKQAQIDRIEAQLEYIQRQQNHIAYLASLKSHAVDQKLRTEEGVQEYTEDNPNEESENLSEAIASVYGQELEVSDFPEKWVFFTDEEIAIITSLYRESDYSDENFLITDYDTIVTQVDVEKQLLKAATDRLDIESHPQLNFTIQSDDLFNIEEFKVLRDNFKIGDFITLGFGMVDVLKNTRNTSTDEDVIDSGSNDVYDSSGNDIVGQYDNYYREIEYLKTMRLRCVEVNFSGLKTNTSFSLTFSTMQSSKYDTNDYESLLNDYITSQTNQISARATSSASATASSIATSIIRSYVNILKAEIEEANIQKATVQELYAVYGNFETLLADYLKVKTAEIEYASVDMMNVDLISSRDGSSWWNLNTGELSLAGYLIRAVVQYAIGTSSTTPPNDSEFIYTEIPEVTSGQYVWTRTILYDGAGEAHPSAAVCMSGGGADGEDGEDAVVVRGLSSNGLIIKNSSASTTISVEVQKGSLVITDMATLRAAYNSEDAYIVWKTKQASDADYTTVNSSDPRITDSGFKFTLSPSDIAGSVDVVYEVWV